MTRAGTAGTITLPAPRSSVLVIITDQDSSTGMKTVANLLGESARAGERIVILGERDGAVLGSSTAPAQPRLQAPEPPASLPVHPTSFQKARYLRAAHDYQQELQRARRVLRQLQHTGLAAWTHSIIAQADFRARQQHWGSPGIPASLGQAAAVLSSLRQSGGGFAVGEAIAVVGVDPAAALSAPGIRANLQGGTVVIDDFPGSSDEEAAWQAALDQGGARRAVILTPATGNQLAATIKQGLDGAVTDTLTSVLFGVGQYTLQPAALPQLRRLLHLLTITYPDATASIDGYTDDLPAPGGGNDQLSQHRADEVFNWLVANNVPASRLQAVGYGDTDPVAPNTPDGQPLNRRVVVIIDPATGN